MEGILGLLVGGGIPVLFLVFHYLKEKQIERTVLDAAHRLGFSVEGDFGNLMRRRTPRIRGSVRGQEVRIVVEFRKSRFGNDRKQRRVIVRVSPSGGVPYHIEAVKEGITTALKKMFAGEDILLGDQDFDNVIMINGNNEEAVISLMDSGTRQLMQEMIGWEGWEIGERSLRRDITDLATNSAQIVALIERAVSLSERLGRGGSVEDRLIENLRCEPNLKVRQRNLEMLLRVKRTPAVEEALLRATQDNAWPISVPAAEALGQGGIRTLIAATISAPAHLAIQAILALKQIGNEEAVAAIRDALDYPKDEIVAVAAEAAGERKDVEAVEPLCRVVHRTCAAGARAAAARALGHFRTDSAHTALLHALGCSEEEVRFAAIQSLGRSGIAEDVADLMEIEKSGPGRLRAAARQAIASIQSRLGRVERGWVSMAEQTAAAGALSVEPDAVPGALSVAETDSDVERTEEASPETKRPKRTLERA